jgi:hypothetical protein
VKYLINDAVTFHVGFELTVRHVVEAIRQTNIALGALPFTLYKSIDYKTSSSIVGALFCAEIASVTTGIVNPIEKGHPDVLPGSAAKASEERLRNYPEGLEVKTTIGSVTQGRDLRAGSPRIGDLTAITWQAHHREVRELLGLVWDFVPDTSGGTQHFLPTVTGAFYTRTLEPDDWGAISGTTGRNTKVTAMKTSGRAKMGRGWVAVFAVDAYVRKYTNILAIPNLTRPAAREVSV